LELKNKSYLILETKNIFKFLQFSSYFIYNNTRIKKQDQTWGAQKNEFLGQHKRKKWHGRQEGGGLKKKKNNNRYNLEVAQLKLAGYISWFIVFILFKYANSILQRGQSQIKNTLIHQTSSDFIHAQELGSAAFLRVQDCFLSKIICYQSRVHHHDKHLNKSSPAASFTINMHF